MTQKVTLLLIYILCGLIDLFANGSDLSRIGSFAESSLLALRFPKYTPYFVVSARRGTFGHYTYHVLCHSCNYLAGIHKWRSRYPINAFGYDNRSGFQIREIFSTIASEILLNSSRMLYLTYPAAIHRCWAERNVGLVPRTSLDIEGWWVISPYHFMIIHVPKIAQTSLCLQKIVVGTNLFVQ